MRQREALGPSRRHIGEHEAVEIAAFGARAAVGDEVGFQKAWSHVIPIGERPHGDLVFEERAGFRGRDASWLLLSASRLQEPICSSCARVSSLKARWPWRSRDATRSGKNGTSRLAQIWLAAAHASSSAAC